MIADLSKVNLDIIRQTGTVNESGRIIAYIFLNPFDMGLEICSSDLIPSQSLQKITDPGRYKISLGI